jgi:hypothetical protein
MSDERAVSPINGLAPPAWGQWKPGQSGNPEGGRIAKKYKQAIETALALLGDGDPQKTRVKIATAQIARAMQGDMNAIKDFADREDGKPESTPNLEFNGPVQLTVTWRKDGE